MFLKSITFSISNELGSSFEEWVKNELTVYSDWIHAVQTYRLLTKVDENSTNFSVQFEFNSPQQLEIFLQLHLDLFVLKAQQRFGGNLLYFITLLEKF